MGIFDSQQKTTQDHLDIADIRNDVVVLKNGKVSLVIETTSLNFELLADREQDVRIITFAGLLNSLHFPIQIVIRTQQKDVSKYKEVLETYKQRSGTEAVKQQIDIYQEFVSALTYNSVILDKRFYAIIPTVLASSVQTGGLRQIFGKPAEVFNVDKNIEKAMLELSPKRDHMIKQFSNMGLAARQLNNDELIKLYYSIYEPDMAGLELLNLREDELLVSAGRASRSRESVQSAKAENPFDKNANKGGQVTPLPGGAPAA
jgi:hypothetical protein